MLKFVKAFILLDKYSLSIKEMPVRAAFTYIPCSCFPSLLKYRSLEKDIYFVSVEKKRVVLTPIFVILHKTSQVERVTKRKGTVPPRKGFSEVERKA